MEGDQLSSKDADGPYKATMLWAAAVRGFREGMVLQRHWRQLRSHERCFTAQAAVTWLRDYLRRHPLFADDVSRAQTVRLLVKFAQAGIVAPVRPPRKGVLEFRDDSQLYRLSAHGTPGRSALTLISGRPLVAAEEGRSSPELRLRRTPATQPDRQLTPQQQENRPPAQQQQQQSPFRSAQPRVQSPERLPTPRPLQERLPPPPPQQLLQPPPPALPQCRPVARQLSEAEVDNVWCNVLLGRLERLLDAPLVDIVPAGCVVPAWIRHNISSVNERGLVLPLPAGQPDTLPPLPHWLLLAMKSLANWPMHQPPGATPPVGDYAGFQRDVLRVISEYFAALPFPLVPYDLCDPLLAAFLHAERIDRRLRQGAPPADLADGAAARETAPTAAAASATRSVEDLLLLMSPSEPTWSSTPRDNSGARLSGADTPVTGSGVGGGYCRPEDDSVFTAAPVPVTPARESVAMLRRRLLQLGVGGGSEDGEADAGRLQQRRPRAASFLKAIADGKEEGAPPQDGGQFCRAVFQPPLGDDEEPPGYPRQSSGYVGGRGPGADPSAGVGYPLPSPITLQPAPAVLPTRLYPRGTWPSSSLQTTEPAARDSRPLSGNRQPQGSTASLVSEGYSSYTSRSERFPCEGNYEMLPGLRDGSRPRAGVQDAVCGDPHRHQSRRQVSSTSDALSDSHQTSSSSLGISRLMNATPSGLPALEEDMAPNGQFSGYPVRDGSQTGYARLPARNQIRESEYRARVDPNRAYSNQPASSRQRLASSQSSMDNCQVSRPSLHSKATTHSASNVLSCASAQRPGSSLAGRWPSSYTGLSLNQQQQQQWSSARQQAAARPSTSSLSSLGGLHSSGVSSLSVATEPGCPLSDSAVGSSVTSERAADTDTCLETVFGATGPVTRLIRQRSVELLHLPTSRPGSRLSEASTESARGRTSAAAGSGAGAPLQTSIRRHQLRDDSLSRSVKRLKERRRDKQEQKRRRQQLELEQEGGLATDYAAFSSGLSHASEDSALAAPVRSRSGSLASDAGSAVSAGGGRPSAAKAARLLGATVEQVERAAAPARSLGPAALRVWQRRSVADPSRVSQPPLSPLQQAARQRLSVVARDYENVSGLSGLVAPPAAAARPVYHGRFRATSRKRRGSSGSLWPAPAPAHRRSLATDLVTAEGHKLAREALQLLLTLMPPSCRRQLQLLFRFMHKVVGNQRLQLHHQGGARELMLDTFAARVLRPCGGADSDSVLVRRLVGYMLDHQGEIMAPALAVAEEVRERVRGRQRETVQFSCDAPVTFCDMVTTEEYGREQTAATTQSLLSLLDVIIADTAMPRKDKRKKLKQFRETYPDIYGRRLQEAERELQTAGEARRTRPFFSGSLTSLVRSKSLRI